MVTDWSVPDKRDGPRRDQHIRANLLAILVHSSSFQEAAAVAEEPANKVVPADINGFPEESTPAVSEVAAPEA